MKKLIAWLAKGSRIVKILRYVYGALVAVNSSLSGIEHGLDISGKESPSGFQKACKYVVVCVEALEKILSWFGIDTFECRSIANEQLDPEELSKRIAALSDDKNEDPNTAITFQ